VKSNGLSVTPKQFKKFLDRDFGHCCHCGVEDDTLIPQHRSNRGMGSVKSRNADANIIVMCSAFNGLIESDAAAQAEAIRFGWKLQSWDNPELVPIWDVVFQQWFSLSNDGSRVVHLDE
jgi:hypothetical protein